MFTVVAASLAALVALGLLAGGLLLVGAHAFLRDDDGYYASPTERFETSTYALTTEGLQLRDVGWASGWLLERTVGRVRIRATAAGGEPVFVGVARERDIDRWLSRVAHEEVGDVRFGPFSYDSVRRSGAAAPGRPADQAFWVASAAGSGPTTVEWKVGQARWGVVVMNAEARRGVRADVRVAVRPRLVVPVAIGLLVAGLFVLAVAGAGLWAALREGRR